MPLPSRSLPDLSWPDQPDARAERLQQALSPAAWQWLQRVIAEAEAHRLPLYLVGGFVRDLLLGRPTHDFDLVVEGDAIALARALAARYGGRVTAHHRFGTAQWHLDNPTPPMPELTHLDFVSARSETYARPGALPTVTAGTIADDLRRRDFTINALAIRLNHAYFGELRDDFGGLNDLQQGQVRALHPASYTDDPTRILRAVRYEQRYAFRIAAPDLRHIALAKTGLRALSGERLRHELDLILEEEHAPDMLARLEALGILTEIHHALLWDKALRPAFVCLQENAAAAGADIPDLRGLPRRRALGYLLWLGRQTEDALRSLASRLDFPASLREALLALTALWRDLPALAPARPSLLTARFDLVPPLALYALALQLRSLPASSSTSPLLAAAIERYLTLWRHIKPRTTGSTLKGLGIPPGPVYQAILWRLRAAWLDGEISRPAEEKALLRALLRASQRSGESTDEPATLP